MKIEKDEVSAVVEIQKIIKRRLLEQNDAVRETYIQLEVQNKLNSRVEIVRKAIVEIANIQKDLMKIKPDQVCYDENGKIMQELYSKDLVERKNKLSEKLGKIEKALTKAFESADYTDLENCIK